jgi:hypothetical protein
MYTKTLIIIIVLLIVIIYIHYYNNYKNDYNIIQTFVDKVDLTTVYEKYPIVIYDKIINPNELLKTLFAYAYVFKNEAKIRPILPTYNKSKHMIIWNADNDILINIINPKYIKNIVWQTKNKYRISTKPLDDLNEVQYITVKLKSNQVIILPAFWIYQCDDYTNIIQLNDLLSCWVF